VDPVERQHLLKMARDHARSGQYADWHAVCRKMLFDGYAVEIFEDRGIADEIDDLCAKARY
jgi:hypothetical protein